MTSRDIRRQAVVGLRKRHVSEVVVIDTLGRRRNRKLMQATPADTSPSLFGLMVAIAFLAAPLVWAVLFAFMLFVVPGPVR